LNDLVLPIPLRVPIYYLYSIIFGCNLNEIDELDLNAFENLGQFFYRKIKSESRPITSANEAALVMLYFNKGFSRRWKNSSFRTSTA
jgi:phosphatidylserine decarboxylase